MKRNIKTLGDIKENQVGYKHNAGLQMDWENKHTVRRLKLMRYVETGETRNKCEG